MTALDGLLVIGGFFLGCLPVAERLVRRGTPSFGPFKRVERPLVVSPWISLEINGLGDIRRRG